jgi:hypothetical protein
MRTNFVKQKTSPFLPCSCLILRVAVAQIGERLSPEYKYRYLPMIRNSATDQ